MNADRAPNCAYQSAVFAAQDEETKTLSCRRCGAEKETSAHILCECPVLEEVRMWTLDFGKMDPEQIKDARLSGIVVLGRGAELLNSPL